MENKEFERFSKAWSTTDSHSSSQKNYSEKEIKRIKMKKSLDFSRSINNSIVFDYILKSILIAGMLLLLWFYKSDTSLLLVLCGLVGFSIFLIFKEVNIRSELIKIEDYTQELGSVLKLKIEFYQKHFPALKIMLAITNSMLVWVGSMFYSYAKYDRYRIDDFTDILVVLMMVSLAFGISYYSLSYLFRLNVLDLEESLMNLDDQEAVSAKIEAQQRRKKKFKTAMIIAIIIGMVLFLLFLISYLNF